MTSTPREPAASASTSTAAAPSTASSASSYSQPLASETTAANLRTSAWSPAGGATTLTAHGISDPAGTVKAVHAVLRQSVASGTVLVELEITE